MKKKILVGLGVIAIAVATIVNVNFGDKRETISCLTLSTLEAQACCRMQESNGYQQFCHCGYTGYCPCLDGWSTGRAFFD